MKIRKLDENHDWTFGKGKSNYSTENIAIEQNVQCRILSWYGDCFFALKDGVDWRNMLDKNQQQNLLLEIKTIILQTEGVIGCTELSANLDSSRKLSISYSIDTIYGQTFKNRITQGQL